MKHVTREKKYILMVDNVRAVRFGMGVSVCDLKMSQTLRQLLLVLSFNWRREKIVPAKVVGWRATLYLGKGQPAGKREKPWELRRSHVSWAIVQACTSQWELFCSIWPKGDDFSLMVVVSVHARLHTFLPPMAFTLLARAKGTTSLACVLYK